MAQVEVAAASSDSQARVDELFGEIKTTFGLPFVPNLFKAMEDDPAYLEATWNQFKTVMAPGELTRREKEMIAVAVSATNSCRYCVTAHTAVLRSLGLSTKGILELMEVVGLFNNFNAFVDGLQLEPDVGVRAA